MKQAGQKTRHSNALGLSYESTQRRQIDDILTEPRT